MTIRSPHRALGAYLGVVAAIFFTTVILDAQGPIGRSSVGQAKQNAAQDRDLFEFKVFKGNDPVMIGDVKITVKSVDKNNQKYTIDLYVGVQKHEKKDVYAGEPIYFYVGNDEQPHEFLVRTVFDDRVEGRLSSPKTAPASPPAPPAQ